MKKTLLISLFLILSLNCFSQTIKKIYFLADTINVSKKNKALEIKWTTPFHYSFIFYCKCVPPYFNYLEFAAFVDKKAPKIEVVNKKPEHNFISLKQLLDMAGKSGRTFDNSYDLSITEVLPKSKYKTYQVKMVLYGAPTIDVETIKQKQ